MKKDGHRYECGCVHGHYWCKKHDIYTKRDPKDPPPHQVQRQAYKDFQADLAAESCSCHIGAPCSFCENQTEDE